MRVFIIANSRFPRGSALANYVQYIALAILNIGYDVILISDINPEFDSGIDIDMGFDGFHFKPFHISNNRIIKHFQYKTAFSRQKIDALNKCNISNDDIVISLAGNGIFLKKLLEQKKRIGFKIAVPVLEMFEEKDIETGKKAYLKLRQQLDEFILESDIVIPISTFIDDFYINKGCRTFLLPIMADCQEFDNKPKQPGKYRFILPANGMMKDDLPSMLKAFTLLTSDELQGIELHVCGVKEDKIQDILTSDEYKKIESSLIVHKWMKYDELVAIYHQMHFLILARKTCQMTLANFPSKVPETMSFGIVPVCSDVGDYTKYYLEDGTDSIFINGSSEEECCNSIRKAMHLSWDEYLKYSQNARNTVQSKFDYRVWSSKIGEVLTSL